MRATPWRAWWRPSPCRAGARRLVRLRGRSRILDDAADRPHLVWDNLNTHLTAGMHPYIADRDWLTVCQLRPYAPRLNQVEGIWSVLRRTTWPTVPSSIPLT
ncbi:transposase [Streptomyces chartreusis]